jgi:1-deoxy-D-xylulose-5-phosphate synthase
VRTLGLPQQFFEHGSRGQVLADAGLTEQDVARRIVEWAARVADRAAAPVETQQSQGVEGQQQ